MGRRKEREGEEGKGLGRTDVKERILEQVGSLSSC